MSRKSRTLKQVARIPVIGKLFEKTRSDARVYRGIHSLRRTASPLYYLIRAFFKTVIRTQHSEIQAIGLENIPADGPVILVGNHPNSFLDYFNLINIIRHPVATAAKDVITNWFIIGPLLRNHMLMVPIARKQDQSLTDISEDDRREANEKSVRESVELLCRGRLYNIFAEGRSTDSRKLNNIKMGFMFMAIQAEKEFNFRLNMRIVPYGFFYDRINKFQSAVCVVFGRPIKLKDLTEIPDDFLAESESDQHTVEKKIMFNGKKRLQKDIEELIISIPDKNLVDLIDDATQLYVLSPIKYMGRYNNVSEKYRLSKVLNDSIQGANQTEEGRERLSDLKRKIGEYRSNLKRAGLRDAVIRREHTGAEIGYHIRVFLKGILLSPLIGYGWLANLIPRMIGRFMRYKVIEVQRRPKVDGDESAIIGATVSALILYPVISVLLYYFLAFGGGLQSLLQLLQEYGPITSGVLGFAEEYSRLTSGLLAAINFYLMARLWRFSLYHGSEFRSAAYWLYDSLSELLSSTAVRKLREQRYEIIDSLDFLIGDYY